MKKIIKNIFLAANVITVLLMALTGFSGVINPETFPKLSVIGLAFPAFLIATVAFIAFWVVVDLKNVYVSFLGLLVCFSPVTTYVPIHNNSDEPEKALKVLSYNVLGFNPSEVAEGEDNPIVQYLIDSHADVIALQEYGEGLPSDKNWGELRQRYPHLDTIKVQNEGAYNVIAVMSKYPIRRKTRIPIESSANLAGAFTLLIDGRDVMLVNVHLESTGLSPENKQGFKDIVHGNSSRLETKQESKDIIRKLAEANARRAAQARVIDDFLRRNAGHSTILCGDFNDHPLSYTHRTIASRLTDCYTASGTWVGYSYCKDGMRVRIDNIMCSDDYTPCGCVVDHSISLSDHYPIYTFIKK